MDGLKRIVLVDNYDSFTWNLVHLLTLAGANVRVVSNDAVLTEALLGRDECAIVVSPGPSGPESAGISVDAIRHYAGRVPILGVCLGHQCIAHAFGGTVSRASEPRHGKVSLIEHDGHGIFAGLANPLRVARYHSLAVAHLPEPLFATAWAEDGTVMALRHRTWPIDGIQFHPESFLSDEGQALAFNWIRSVPPIARPESRAD